MIDKPQFAQVILDQGLFTTLEQIISKAINQLTFDHEHPSENIKTRQNKAEEYQFVIEQAFLCLSDIVHFIEHGQILQELTQSPLVVKTMQLARNCQEFAHIINARILKQMSIFLRELSNDNSFVKSL